MKDCKHNDRPIHLPASPELLSKVELFIPCKNITILFNTAVCLRIAALTEVSSHILHLVVGPYITSFLLVAQSLL